jgi:hypothetical protein
MSTPESSTERESCPSTSQPEEGATKLISAFNDQYPDIDVSVFRSGTEEATAKTQATQCLSHETDPSPNILLTAKSLDLDLRS